MLDDCPLGLLVGSGFCLRSNSPRGLATNQMLDDYPIEWVLGLYYISALTNQMLDDYPIEWFLGLCFISALTNQMLDHCPIEWFLGLCFISALTD